MRPGTVCREEQGSVCYVSKAGGGETLAVQSPGWSVVSWLLEPYPNQQHHTPCMRQPSAAGMETSTGWSGPREDLQMDGQMADHGRD